MSLNTPSQAPLITTNIPAKKTRTLQSTLVSSSRLRLESRCTNTPPPSATSAMVIEDAMPRRWRTSISSAPMTTKLRARIESLARRGSVMAYHGSLSTNGSHGVPLPLAK